MRRRHFERLVAVLALLAMQVATSAAGAEEPPREKSREIYVPFSELHILLEHQPKRVLLGRDEYDALLKRAKQSPDTHAPQPALIAAADYTVNAAQQRAEIRGLLTVEVLEDGLHALPLDLSGVGLQAARLDDRAAPIGRAADGRLLLFVEGVGQHRLQLEMVAPLETTAARGMLNFRLPRPPAAKLHLTAPGDVEIKAGAEVISRTVDKEAKLTRFELLPHSGDTSLAMTLNSHLQRQGRAVMARSVLIDEMTESYERLTATVTFEILHRPIDAFQFVVPEGFEITDVESPLLARWDVHRDGARRLLDARLREATTEMVTLRVAAIRTPVKLGPWLAPRLSPLDVLGNVTVVGLLVDDRLKAESLAAEGLIPIDVAAISSAPPINNAHAPQPMAAWYAPQSDYSIAARFVKPPAELAVTTSLLLVASDKGMELLGGLSLLPQVERRFSFDLQVPAGWQVMSVANADGGPLPFESFSPLPMGKRTGTNTTRVRVTIPGGIAVGQELKANFRAVSTPPAWLADWKSKTVDFPNFAVLDVAAVQTAIAVDARDDMTVRPEKVAQLTPLGAAEKAKYGLANVNTTLAYRCEGSKYSASLVIERTAPRLTTRTFSFFRVDRDALNCHYELVYTVEEARTGRLAFSLPADTPESLSITALDGVTLKEYTPELRNGRRRWNVLLAEPRRGRLRLAVDFQQPLPMGQGGNLPSKSPGPAQPASHPKSLPLVVAADVAYQSGLVAVEGCAELDVRVETTDRPVDVGELAEADYQPGRRLLGAYSFAGDPPPMRIDVLRHPGYGLFATIVQQCQLDTNISPQGWSQTQAVFKLRTKAVFLQVRLPAGAELWSAELDDVPLKPQREGVAAGSSVLIDVPAAKVDAVQKLQIVYASPVGAVSIRGTVDLPAPKLFLRAENVAAATTPEKSSAQSQTPPPQQKPVEVPLADLVWRLHLPNGYEIVRADGTLTTDQLNPPRPAALQVAGKLYWLAGGVSRPVALLSDGGSAPPVKTASRFDATSQATKSELPPPSRANRQSTDLARSPAERRIYEALKSPTELEFKDTPLSDVIDYLKDQHKIEIQIDTKALSDAGVHTDTPITKSLKGISLRSALRLMLKEHGLTYSIRDDALMITTPEDADSRLSTKVYPVADLVTFMDKSGETWTDVDSLIDTIKSTATPTSWDDVGGSGSIASQSAGGAPTLVVSATEETQDEIAALLEQLRQLGQTVQPGQKPPLREKLSQKADGVTRDAGGKAPPTGMGGMGFGGSWGKAGEKKDQSTAIQGEGRGQRSPKAEPAKSAPNAPATVPPTAAFEAPSTGRHETDRDRDKTPTPHREELNSVENAAVPPIVYPDAESWKRLSQRRKARSESLLGVASLKINVLQSPEQLQEVVTFRSLGAGPRLSVTLVDRSRLAALGWGLALTVALIGAAITRHPARSKSAYILAVMIVATLLPLAIGSIEVAQLCNMLFYAASLLVPWYLLVAFARWLIGLRRPSYAAKTASLPVVALLLAIALHGNAIAQSKTADDSQTTDSPYVVRIATPPAPVKMPEDAIILPYDPDSKDAVKRADKVLVPYDRYVALWNRAHPDKKIASKTPPAPYALAGTSYKTLLDGDDYLLLTGQVEIDVFTDEFVQVPLGLSGGVLSQAQLDGQPARLSVVAPAAQRPPQSPFAQPQADPREQSLIVLQASGKGHHRLELSVRLKLSRQGGWRVADGVLPTAPAAAVEIVVPKPRTELRLGEVTDRRQWETERPDETIRTALSAGGAIRIAWRPEVAQAETNRTLAAASVAVLDVQEDGLRLSWRLGLDFRRAEREQFNLDLPADYLLEKVDGSNVRGWEVRKSPRGQTLRITLLQAAKDHEEFTLWLWRSARAAGSPASQQFDVPLVTMPEAALHRGELTIRRSPLLDLRTVNHSGVTRIDLPEEVGSSRPETSPLGIRPFEAYRFAAVPFSVRLEAKPATARASATVQSVLRLSEYERQLESRVLFDVQGRSVYQLQMYLPAEFVLDHVTAPGDFQYAVTAQNGRMLLTIYLAAGQSGDVPVLLLGKLGVSERGQRQPTSQAEVSLPRLEVLGVDRQQGDIAVQVDPAFDVEALRLTHCESVLLGQLFGWLQPTQRPLTRLALHYTTGDYSGALRLTARKAEVDCDTISNVRVTDRALEETILLNFTIQRAGIRRLSFLLPAEMADARISVPMLRQKTIEPTSKERGAPVRVRIELQDEVMGQLRVLVQNDRLLVPGSHEAPIPTVELCRVNRRYVVIENAGRDAIAVEDDRLREVDPLSRRQKEWETLQRLFGRQMTMAYLASPDARQPRLSFHTESHAAVATVKASIGLAESTVVLDAAGAYRAQAVLRLNNATEQFLEIRLPEGAELWAARVADEPVKPTQVPGKPDPRAVRVPLIKTAVGDLYYEVVLKYGGRMPAFKPMSTVNVPLLRCVNIQPDLSQVQLYVPEQYRWFDFGGSMRRVEEDADLQAGYVQFMNNQLQQISLALRQGDDYTKARAVNNLKQIGLALHDQFNRIAGPSSGDSYSPSNAQLQSALIANARIMQEAQQEAAAQQQAPQEAQARDNRNQLQGSFKTQSISMARNVAVQVGGNWADASQQKNKTNYTINKPQGAANANPSATRVIVQETGEDELDGQSTSTTNESLNRYKQRLAAQTTQTGKTGLQSAYSNARDAKESAAPEGQPPVADPFRQRLLGRLEKWSGAAAEIERPGPDDAAPPPAAAPAANQPAPTGPQPTVFAQLPAQQPAQPPANGLASLDVELPTRGTLLRFTTPRGDAEITARNLSDDLLRRLIGAGVVVAVLLAAWFAVRLAGRVRFGWLTRPLGTWLLIAVGLLSLCAGILPVAGLAAILTGFALKLHRRIHGVSSGSC